MTDTLLPKNQKTIQIPCPDNIPGCIVYHTKTVEEVLPKNYESLREQIATIEVGGHQLQNFAGSVFIDKVVELINARDTKMLEQARLNTLYEIREFKSLIPYQGSKVEVVQVSSIDMQIT